MNYKNLFFHAIFINSFLAVAITCSDDRQTRLDNYSQAIKIYTQLEEDHLYTSEGENLMICVQSCLRDILQHDDARCCSPNLKNIMQNQSATDELLNKENLKNIARKLKLAYK